MVTPTAPAPWHVAAFRDRLIGEGIVYSPAYGELAFTVPQLDDYVRRTFPRLADDPPSP